MDRDERPSRHLQGGTCPLTWKSRELHVSFRLHVWVEGVVMRTVKGAAKIRAKKRLFRKVKGYVGGRRKLLRTAKETLVRAGVYAFRDRKNRKRSMRALWITRLSAALRMREISYSRFIAGLVAAKIELNRKILSEMAIHDPEGFDAVVAAVRKALPPQAPLAKPSLGVTAKTVATA